MHADDSRTAPQTYSHLLRIAGLLAIITSAFLVLMGFAYWPILDELLVPSSAPLWTLVPPVAGGALLLARPDDARWGIVGACVALLGVLYFTVLSRSPAYFPVLALLAAALFKRLQNGPSFYFETRQQAMMSVSSLRSSVWARQRILDVW